MKLNFPLKTIDLRQWKSTKDHYEATISEHGGWYPVGKNRFWHGGVHLDGNHPVHALADGHMIAYRVTDSYLDLKTLKTYKTAKNKDKTIVTNPISDNFVLTKHTLKSPEGDPFSFHVLYMHLLPLKEQGEEQKNAPPIFLKNRFHVKQMTKPDGAGLDLVEFVGETKNRLVTMPKGAFAIYIEEKYRQSAAIHAGYQRVSFSFYDIDGNQKEYNGYARLEDNVEWLGNNKVRIKIDRDISGVKTGLNIHEQMLSTSDVIDIAPMGAELLLEEPGDAVDENAKLKPCEDYEKYRRITGLEFDGKTYKRSGYVKVDESTVEINKYFDYELGKPVSCDVAVRKGMILGWAGGDGNLKDGTTVHMEIFIADDKNFEAFKKFTESYNEDKTVHEEQLLKLNSPIKGSDIDASYIRKQDICDTKKLLTAAFDKEGEKTISVAMETVMADIDYYDRILSMLRRIVVKNKSEWQTHENKEAEFKRLKTQIHAYNQDKFDAYNELFIEKLDFWDKIPVLSEAKEPYFFHPIKFIHHIRLISKEDEIIFVLNSKTVGEEKFLVLTPRESAELEKEEQVLTQKIENLKKANESQDPQKIKTAKNQIMKALTSHSEGGGYDNLTEIRRLSGRKTTYVRSDKIKNHWRTYSLDADDRKKSLKTKSGQLDTKKLKDRFLNSTKKISKKWPLAADSIAGLFSENFEKYIEGINESLKWSCDEKKRDPEKVNFDCKAEAQLLRYYANAALEAEIDFKKMRFGVNGNINASIALAEGKFESNAYWPSEGGCQLKFELPNDKGVNQKYDFGAVRARLELNATALVGASAVGSINLEFKKPGGMGKDKDKLVFRGVNKVGKNIKPDDSTAGFKLFAGVEAGGEVVGKCEWDNPEKWKKSKPAWCEFAAIGYGLKGAAGFGGEFEFKISYKGGKFLMQARAGLVLGLGAGGGIVAAINAGTIMEFVQFIYHQLKNYDFSLIAAIEPVAFEAITRLSVWAVETGEAIEDFVEDTKEAIEDSVDDIVNKVKQVEDWWLERRESIEQAQELANRVLSKPEILKYTTPEAKGIMLHTLTKTHNKVTDKYKKNRGIVVLNVVTKADEEQLDLQERAIIRILEHVQSITEYQMVCKRISLNASKIKYQTGHMKICQILDEDKDEVQRFQFMEMRHKWRQDLLNRMQASNWEEGWKNIFNKTTIKNSPVEVMTLV